MNSYLDNHRQCHHIYCIHTCIYSYNGREIANFIYEIEPLVKNSIYFRQNDTQVNEKSMLGMLRLNLKQYEIIEIIMDKEDYFKIENIIKNMGDEIYGNWL